MAKVASSYLRTNGAALTRAADQCYWSNVIGRPQAMTIYCRFVEVGGITVNDGFVFNVGGTGVPQFNVIMPSGGAAYRIRHFNATSSVTGTLATAPTVGQVVELVAQLSANGSVQLHQSINGATATSTTASGALALAAAWNLPRLSLAEDGNNSFHSAIAFRDVVIFRGVKDITTMRRLAGT